MNFLTYSLTQKITKCLLDKAIKDGSVKDDSGQVRSVSIYGVISWVNLLLGAIFGGISIFFDQLVLGAFLFLLFGMISIPVLCVTYNCRLIYDEKGFTWRNALRICHRYSYEDVTGLYYNDSLRVVVELNNHKRLDFDQSWINRQEFAQAIRKYRSQKPPKLPSPILGMSSSEIENSYDNGILLRALIVKENDRKRFGWFKWLHYGICTISSIFAAFSILCARMFQGEDKVVGLAFLVLPGMLCVLLSLYLYFRYPQYFTAREIPSEEVMPKQKKKYHKRCTLVWTSLMSVCGGALFFISQMNQNPCGWLLWIAAGTVGLQFWALLVLFCRFSWEYQNFRVGYVSFAVWQGIFCVTTFFALAGLLIG